MEFVPLALLAAFLAVIGAAYIAVTLMDRRYRFGSGQQAADWANRIQPLREPDTTPPSEGLSPPGPLPPLPPMEAGPDLPAHTGHRLPAVRLPPLTQAGAPFVMPQLPGRTAAEPEPTVFAAHTPGSASRHARAAARHSDPEVVRHLDEADWWAHHLINLTAIRNQHEVI